MKYKNRILILSLLIITSIICLLIFYPIKKKIVILIYYAATKLEEALILALGATKIQIAKVKSCNNGDIFLEKSNIK